MRPAPFWRSHHRYDMSCCQTNIVEAIGHVAGVGHIRCGASHSRPTLAFSRFLIRLCPGWDGLPIDASAYRAEPAIAAINLVILRKPGRQASVTSRPGRKPGSHHEIHL